MTKNSSAYINTQAKKEASFFRTLLSLIIILLTFILSFSFSDKITHSVESGLSLCAKVIIPSVFPFIVISDLLSRVIDFSSAKSFGKLFEKLFGINRVGIYPLTLGLLCGFPLGVKSVSELYERGAISKDEAERLIGFCNNTGPAFLVSGVGLGLRKSLSDGIALYAAMVLSSLAVGILFSIGKKPSGRGGSYFLSEKFSLTRSIKNAGVGTLNVCSYLTFFACIVGLLRNLIGHNYIYLTLVPFLEIGSAASILSKTDLLTPSASLCATAFAIGFSGLSVHLQALSYISDTDISSRRYFVMKLLQGAFSLILIYLYCLLSAF